MTDGMGPERPEWAAWSRYPATVALVAAATAAGVFLRGHLAPPDLVMLYLLGIVVVATRFGRGPSLLASALSVLAFDYFFVPPFHTFAVADERYLLTFATMFGAGLLISALASRVRRHQREAGEREQRAAAAELRARTEEMRSSLLSAVSHDLRTPLGAITGAATTLREGNGELDPAQRADLIDTICEEAERLERFVVNLLEMTRLEAGALEVKREWVPLEELVGSALTRLEERLEGRPVHAPLPADLPLISVDPVLMGQVFYNLLENAAKHTPPSSPVEISARVAGGSLVVELSDHGPGLPAGAEALVFDKFYRAAPGGTRGAGLGLAICRGIVQAHGGTISAETRPQGGATFRITLPLTGEAPSVPAEPELA